MKLLPNLISTFLQYRLYGALRYSHGHANLSSLTVVDTEFHAPFIAQLWRGLRAEEYTVLRDGEENRENCDKDNNKGGSDSEKFEHSKSYTRYLQMK